MEEDTDNADSIEETENLDQDMREDLQENLQDDARTEAEADGEIGEEIREEVDEGISEVEERIEDEKIERQEQKNEEIIEEKPEIKEPDKKPENTNNKESKPEKDLGKKTSKKSLAVFGIIVVVIAILIILYALLYNPEKANKFTYNNLEFEKIQFGGIYVYETNITLIKAGFPTEYNFRLRTDPRELGKIPVNYSSVRRTVYFTFPQETLNCSSDSLIAAFQVGQYLGTMGFSVSPAVTENFSGNTLPVVSCSQASKTKSVIFLRPFANETRIYQQENGCIVLEAKNCQVIEISERFILSVLEKLKSGSQTTPNANQNSSNKSNSS